ncbi:ABC transporter ATP-binding protein [Macrococcus armenti]|uniref:ABC transporter ATP-binding protein n=1 Tax=Macrococcus armenti TaxID=2875764 RepID=UPI001CCD8568|nr:ABC transporter ATP-binding protein [Macrococcus armenti]UBH11089.1 ABC transporter ATP-binding protein [Macrococcus armenti]UBH15568.1 ABC transporter ATP-binding protein [Macrococcus armenti]UBH17929.1 ABC transporter ATP-binding protein [Macrococcus armenti]UBH20194.1 ABC transporter ATP-binding protein [Macrococcus armenti]
MIDVQGLSHRYGDKEVLEDINFHIEKHEKIGLIGRNGAGKSTLLKLMLNMEKIQKGTVTFNGESNKNEKWKASVSYLPEKFKLYQSMTPLENLKFFNGLIKKKFEYQNAEEVLNKVGLLDDKNTRINQFSKGMLQRLGIAITLMYDTEIIILDEPTSGLDPIGRKEILDLINLMKDKTILMSSHHYEEVKEVCSHVLLLDNKQINKMDMLTFEQQYLEVPR